MRNSKLLKGITLSGFVMMLCLFVAYRSGAFNDNNAALLNNGDYISKMPVDSPPAKQTIMPSSKSGAVFERPQSGKTGSAVSTNTYVPQDVMPSTKSAGVFHENDVRTNTVSPVQNNNRSNINQSNNNAAPVNNTNRPANQSNRPK